LPFAYDPSDNLTSGRGFSFGYNANNQITNSGFGYDVNGNATLFNNVGHVYDYENRVLQAGFIQADYRPDGKRAWKQPGDRSTRTYYVYDGGRVILEFNPANGFYQAYAYGANGLACSERQDGHLVYAFDPAGNLVHRLRDGTVLSNSWFDSYGGLLYDDSATGVRPYPSPDSVGYQGQWGAYTDVENRALHLRGDYYSAAYARWLTRQSAGVNEYSAGVNPVHSWVDPLQDLLSLVGVFDPTGAVDVVNAVGYALRGKWGSAAVTALGIIPYVGDVAKAGKAGHAVAALAKQGARQAARNAAEQTFSRFMSKAGLQVVQETGLLRGGRLGETYFTVNRYRTGRSAMRYLSLPNPPKVRLDFKVLNQPRTYGPRVVEPKYGQLGGGTELWTVDEPVRVRILHIVELVP